MNQPRPDTLRNIGIISHIDAGKTTVSERILFYTDEIHRMGEVHDGQATMDWMEQEQERGITITATCTCCRWQDHWLNLIDTPGHIDFTIEVERSLRALDGAVTIFSAVEGVQPQSESVWRQAAHYNVPRLCLINKMDRTGADYRQVLDQIKNRLGGRPALLQLPEGEEGNFNGVIDLLDDALLTFDADGQGRSVTRQPVPASRRDEVHKAREALIEIAADFDEEILTAFLEGEPLPAEKVRAALRRGTLTGEIFPVLLGSALRNKGVQPLLDAVCAYLPSPLDLPPVQAIRVVDGARIDLSCDPDGPLAALAFKVVADEGRKLTYLRLYSGRLHPGDAVGNGTSGVHEKVARLFRMHAHKRERLDYAEAGDIVAATGIKEVLTGDCLCPPQSLLQLRGLQIPAPVISLAVEPKDIAAREKLLPSLEKLQWEDPTFRVHEDAETGQTLLSGMGELHLEVLVQRLARDFGVEVNTGRPQVVYRESLRQAVTHREIFEREADGKVQFGDIEFCLTPLPRGGGLQLILAGAEGLPLPGADWESGLMTSLEQASQGGACAGFPLTDLEVRVVAVRNEAGHMTETGLRAAAQKGLVEAARKGGGMLLEPVMQIEITLPVEYSGKVLGGLQQKRGRVEKVQAAGELETIHAQVPLSEMFGYMTELRSATRGRGSFSMEFSHFDDAPAETLRRFGLS
jgi:elongation factor G